MLRISTLFAHADSETPVNVTKADSETVYVEVGSIGMWFPFDKALELRNALDCAIPLTHALEPNGAEPEPPTDNEAADIQYRESIQDAGRGHLLR